MMRKISRFLSALSAVAGLLLVVRAPSGLAGGMMWLPKLWAGAWAPFLALGGLLGALVGLLNRDRRAFWAGLLGAALGVRHTVHVTRPQDASFAAAFGADWKTRLAENEPACRSPARYRLLQPALPLIPGQRDVRIGSSGEANQPLLGDLWQPPPGIAPSGLAVLYFHGGLWQAIDKDFLTQPLFRRLARQGHVILDVAYSLAPAADLDRMFADVAQAIGWMKVHAPQYEVDPQRIVLMGEAGGAHLALMAAYAPSHPAFQQAGVPLDLSVRGVVSIAGITDLCAFFVEYGRSNPRQPETSDQIRADLRPRVYDKTWLDRLITRNRLFPAYRHSNMPGGPLLLVYLLGGTLKEVPEAYQRASPIAHVGPHCPPTLHLYADNDFVVDASHGQRLHQALRAAGVPSVYIEYPNTVHAFDLYFGVSRRAAPAAQAAMHDIEKFLRML